MQEIRFSIVIPAYNASKSIVTTLDCVKAQTYRNFEVIIVDDKSADAAELAQVVRSERYQDLAIKLELSEVKLNGAGARNKGIELATGDFISFLDADDEWHPDKLLVASETIAKLEAQGKSRYVIFSQVNIHRWQLPQGDADATARQKRNRGRVSVWLLRLYSNQHHCAEA